MSNHTEEFNWKTLTDFNWKTYIELNDDLKNMTKSQAKHHFYNVGIKEKRKYKREDKLEDTFLSYVPQSDLRHFQHTNRYVRIFQRIKNTNLFDVDLNFIKQAYNLKNYTHFHIIAYIKKTNYIGHIFHPKQLYNLFNNKIKILLDEEKSIYIDYDGKRYKIHEFIQTIDNYSFDDFKNLQIRQIENCSFIGKPLLILFFIGSETNLAHMFEKIKNYYTIQPFSLAFCVNNNIIDIILPLIKSHFNNNFIVYSCNEMGNDIVPSLLTYNEIINNYHFDYIIKIHTKTNVDFLNKATDYLLNRNLNELLSKKNINSSSIGFKYESRINDIFNTKLSSKFSHIFIHSEFVTGTMFLTTKNVMGKVLDFFKENHKVLFLQNMYDNNSLNRDYSHVHFLERLFGYF